MTTSNEQSTLELQSRALATGIATIGQDYAQFSDAVASIESSGIFAVNIARKLGIELKQICGHEQVNFKFWQAHGKELPFKFESAKIFIAIADKVAEPVRTIQEAAAHMTGIFQAQGLLEMSERTEKQTRSTVSIMEKFFGAFTAARVPFEKALQDRPLDTWGEAALFKFAAETEWLASKRELALQLLEAKK